MAVVMADGALLLPSTGYRDDRRVNVMMRIGWGSLDIAESVVPAHKVLDTDRTVHWHSRSPDGRWWLRFDHTCFPTVERSPAPGAPPRSYYGVTVQLWSAFPLRFERRIVLYWLTAETLPDETNIFRPWDLPREAAPPTSSAAAAPERGALLPRLFVRRGVAPSPAASAVMCSNETAMLASAPARDRIYRAISRALDRPDLSPDVPFPGRADFGEEAVHDDGLWGTIKQNLASLVQRSDHPIGWEPENDAVWLERAGFLLRVQMDGGVSPRLWSERFGMSQGKMVPFAETAEQHLPLPGGRLLAIKLPREAIGTMSPAREGGVVTIDGSPAEPRFDPIMIPAHRDGWIPGDAALPPSLRNAARYRETINRMKLEHSIVRVPVKEGSPASRAEAIVQLGCAIGPDFFARADHHEIGIRFIIGDQEIREADFSRRSAPATATGRRRRYGLLSNAMSMPTPASPEPFTSREARAAACWPRRCCNWSSSVQRRCRGCGASESSSTAGMNIFSLRRSSPPSSPRMGGRQK